MPPSAPATLLLVEDESSVREGFQAVLSAQGHRVIATDMVKTAWPIFLSQSPDLAILDLGLPDGSGLDLCSKIRAHPELGLTPVIILTAQSDFDCKRSGFEAGADQYLVKPLAADELVLWVNALLRRALQGEDESIRAGECEVDLKTHLVRFRGAVISDLTPKEFELFYFLVKKQPQVLSRKYILTHLWHTVCVDQVVDTHLSKLRKKLPQELVDKIQSVPGKGFRFLP